MYKAPISTTFITNTPAGGPLECTAWENVQSALGGGLATAIITTPDRRGDRPMLQEYHSNRANPPSDNAGLKRAFDHLIWVWRLPFETLLNRRWSLCDNPYAKVWILPGMLLVHEDPLGWVVDAAAEDLAEGQPYSDDPSWAILRPMPASNHALLHSTANNPDKVLPHSKSLQRALTKAARLEEHHEITPLAWQATPVKPGSQDCLSLTD